MIITEFSRLDPDLRASHIAFILDRFKGRRDAFVETFHLPSTLPSLQCALVGPVMGDDPVAESLCFYTKRGDRAFTSRLCHWAPRETWLLTVSAAPGALPRDEDDDVMELLEVYAGPETVPEMCDPRLPVDKVTASIAFWSEHAFCFPPPEESSRTRSVVLRELGRELEEALDLGLRLVIPTQDTGPRDVRAALEKRAIVESVSNIHKLAEELDQMFCSEDP